MKQIELTQGLFATVDDDDYDFVMQWEWYASKQRSGKYYAFRSIYNKGTATTTSMHRAILGVKGKNVLVDHIDRDTLNNTRNNLRLCNAGGNAANRSTRKGSMSKFLGVTKHLSGKWQAQLGKNKKVHYLGLFDNEEMAAIAYNKAAMILHGPFANLNKVYI